MGRPYLHINADVDIKSGILDSTSLDGSGDWVDAIVGVRRSVRVGDKWERACSGDMGAGGSEFTWQAMASVGYGFDWGDLKVGWRHL